MIRKKRIEVQREGVQVPSPEVSLSLAANLSTAQGLTEDNYSHQVMDRGINAAETSTLLGIFIRFVYNAQGCFTDDSDSSRCTLS